MGVMGRSLTMGSAGFISSTVGLSGFPASREPDRLGVQPKPFLTAPKSQTSKPASLGFWV